MNSHLDNVNESYLKHLSEAWKISWLCLLASGAALIHGLIPRIFTSTASNILKKIILSHTSRQTKV